VCGHSLGGALSIITCAYLLHNYPTRKINLIVFGSPRIVNDELAKFIKDNTIISRSYERDTDPIPTTLSKYYHCESVGKIINLSSFGHKWWQYPLCHEINFYKKALADIHHTVYVPSSRFIVPYLFKFIERFVYINPDN
jgi:hypothetical protein